MVRSLLVVILLSSSFVFAKSEAPQPKAPYSDPSLLSTHYEANPCFEEKHKSLSRSPGFYLMKDGSVVTSMHTRFVGPFKSIADFKKKLDVCTYNHGKMGQGKKDYRIIQDAFLFTPEVTKMFSGMGGTFDGGGASGYWIGPSPNSMGEIVGQASANK